MRVQSRRASIAVEKRVNPREPVVSRHQRYNRGLTGPCVTVAAMPLVHEVRYRRWVGWNVRADLDTSIPPYARCDSFLFTVVVNLKKILRQQLVVQMLMDGLRYRSVEEHIGVERGKGLFAPTLSDNMSDRDALLPRFVGPAGKILLQRALDQQRFGMLAFDLVRIVRVHRPQRLAEQIA